MKKKAAVVPKGKVEKKSTSTCCWPTYPYIHLPQLSILLTLHSTGGGKSVKLRICDMAFVEEAQASSIVLAGLGT